MDFVTTEKVNEINDINHDSISKDDAQNEASQGWSWGLSHLTNAIKSVAPQSSLAESVKTGLKSIAIHAKDAVSALVEDDDTPYEEGTLMYKLDSMAEKAENYIESVAIGIAKNVKGLVQNVVVVEPTKEKGTVSANRFSALIAAMQVNPATYTTDYRSSTLSEESRIAYEAFVKDFQVDEKKEEMAGLLRDNSEFYDLYQILGKFVY